MQTGMDNIKRAFSACTVETIDLEPKVQVGKACRAFRLPVNNRHAHGPKKTYNPGVKFRLKDLPSLFIVYRRECS